MTDYRIFIGQYGNPTRGEWVDATDVDACEEVIARYSDNGAIEVGAFGREGFGQLPDTESIDTLRAVAEYLDGRADADARLAYAAHVGDEPHNLHREFDDAYQGEWRDEETFTEETFCELYTVPKELESYVDFERMARDWFISDFFSEPAPGGGIFVFRHV